MTKELDVTIIIMRKFAANHGIGVPLSNISVIVELCYGTHPPLDLVLSCLLKRIHGICEMVGSL